MEHHRLKAQERVSSTAIDAAAAAADAGGSPRAQIDAARQATGKKLVYMPHIGARQRERALAAMEKSQAKA